MNLVVLLVCLMRTSKAASPYLTGEILSLSHRAEIDATVQTKAFLSNFYLNDRNAYMTSDVGGPITDQNSLSGGECGPSPLEDFIFRQKIQRFYSL